MITLFQHISVPIDINLINHFPASVYTTLCSSFKCFTYSPKGQSLGYNHVYVISCT